MDIEITEEPITTLEDYGRVPIAFEVDRVLDVVVQGDGLDGFVLSERRVEVPYLTGDIPFEAEDLLLALRLLHPGDISFIAHSIVGDDGRPLFQQPYRYFAAIASTHPYHLDPGQVSEVEKRLTLLNTSAAKSTWFSVARRFFLYGGAKEFNTYIEELDRILDYAIALESVLMFEKYFVSRMIRRRATALLKVPEDKVKNVWKFINTFYGHRSTIAHGDPLSEDALAEIRGGMEAFEILVRGVLVAALEVIPAPDDTRKAKLMELAAVTEAERIDFLIEQAKAIENDDRRKSVIDALKAAPDQGASFG
jgi:hypothetical protein